MKIAWYEVLSVVIILCLPGCSNKDDQKQYSSKMKNIHRCRKKNCVIQPTSFHRDGSLTIISSQSGNKTLVEYELAKTPEKRAQGLMYRPSMDEQQGMLFIFDDIAPRYFYMKNTDLSLDILFLDNEKRVVKIYPNTQPHSAELLPSVSDARYALEVCAGFCVRHGVTEGDTLEF